MLASTSQGQLIQSAALADYTSWRVGGLADSIFIPSTVADLAEFLQQLPKEMPLVWLGLGSNVLIRDGGVRGVVIITQGALNQISVLQPQLIRAEAGVACTQIARHTARLSLTGIEFMAGIPGTVGGALAMNAGCYGGETWQRIQAVETINRRGEITVRSPAEYEIAYRHVKGPKEEWFVAGHFALSPGDKDHSLTQIKTMLEKRNAAQPTGLPNCGSVFRNPPGDYAARLIEASGLKKHAIGGAYVSEKHANFIINDGTATAADIEALINYVRDTVFAKQAVRLLPEVCMIGDP